MESHCIRHTEIPGTSRLFADYQYHFDRVSRFYPNDPHTLAGFERAAAAIDYPLERRAALVKALRRTNGPSRTLDLLARPGTVAVVTGQQIGLYTGPAYSIYKALTAIRLAAHLSESGIPAVPVFWLATEDHDFAEVDHCHIFSEEWRPMRLWTAAKGGAKQPVGTRTLVDPPNEALAKALAAQPYGEQGAALAGQAYRSGATLGEAFGELLRGLLAPYDLLYLDPLDAEIRAIAAPFLRSALDAAPSLNAKLRERGRELEAAGYHAQVLIEPETSLLFRLEADRRVALRYREGRYSAGDREYSREELADAPERLSPNAVLRPVMQDYLLPTVAYAGGPSETAYLAQAEVIYRDLLGRMPVAVARSGFTVIPAAAEERMRKFGLTLPALLRPAADVRELASKALVPPGLIDEYAEARQQQRELLKRLETLTLAFDPTLAKALRRSEAKMGYQLAKMERKIEREALRRDQRALAQIESLLGLLYPERHLQERYYSYVSLYAAHGPELVETLYANVHLDCRDHKVIVV